MNNAQKIAIAATAVILILMLLFPPFCSPYGGHISFGYSSLFAPKVYTGNYGTSTTGVLDYKQLSFQFIVIIFAGAAAHFIFKKQTT